MNLQPIFELRIRDRKVVEIDDTAIDNANGHCCFLIQLKFRAKLAMTWVNARMGYK